MTETTQNQTKVAYKVFNADWVCLNMQYKVGKTYTMAEKPRICEKGFHYCPKLIDCFNYYNFDTRNKVSEVEILGDIDKSFEGDKECTNKIKIVRELTWHEVLDLVNIGKNNTGRGNTGNRNTGIYNTGIYNTGIYNTGNYNTGIYNTGNYNTGDYNTGNYNSCDYSTGFFNSVEQPVYFFNKEVKLTRDEIVNLKGLDVASRLKLSEWIYTSDMTEEEKQKYPEHETTGGYLKTYTYKQAWTNLWENATEEDKQAIKDLPNFDKEVFKKITGLSVR